jgi:hypothetical protein
MRAQKTLIVLFFPMILAFGSWGCKDAEKPQSVPESATPDSAAKTADAPAPTHLHRLTGDRTSFHAYGQAGDLDLTSGRAHFVFATKPDLHGHKPLRGALLDATLTVGDTPDPLLFLRQGWEDAAHHAHVLVATAVEEAVCDDEKPPTYGVRISGDVEGVTLTTMYCPKDGGLDVTTSAKNLPPSAFIADELNPGTAEPTFEGVNLGWEGEHDTPAVALDEYDIELRVQGVNMSAERHLVHIAAESFPSALFLRYKDAVAKRTLSIKPAPVKQANPAITSTLSFAYTDATGAPLPVQVVIGVPGSDITPPLAKAPFNALHNPGVFIENRSVYLPRGHGSVQIAPGTYDITATHGPTYTLASTTTAARAKETTAVIGSLRRVVDTHDWTAADFHLHAAPSADSNVPLDARVSALACVGVEFAIATDHNRVTDYAPAIVRVGVADRLSFVRGVEITTPALGHFNAFPMPAPTAAPELSIPLYYEVPPAEIFASARAMGARIIEVNHARMAPRIGYFDLEGFNAGTGSAGPTFSEDFDSFEVHNGFWLEHPDRVREGAADLVGLARRGRHVAGVGNSDSHKLFFEEAGWPRTYVRTSGDGALSERIFKGILRSETSISAGPFMEMTVEKKAPGATITIPKDPSTTPTTIKAHIKVQAPAWIPVERVEVHVDDDVVQTFKVEGPAKDGVRFEADVDIAIDHDVVIFGWADAETPIERVMARKGVRSIAMTSLFYVDADGDGKVTLRQRATL